MKLELKHLAPYLEHFVKFKTPVGVYTLTVSNISCFDYQFSKLMLHPLSDLTKEIEHKGEKFIPIEKLKNIYEAEIGEIANINYHNIDGFTLFGTQIDDSYEISMPYKIYERLFEWHFDVFGLIPEELALDINDLN